MWRFTKIVVLLVVVAALATAYSNRSRTLAGGEHTGLVASAVSTLRNVGDRAADAAGIGQAAAQPAPLPRGAELAVGFSPGNAEATVVAAIDTARRSIAVAAYSFTSRPIATAMLRAKDRGVEVRVVADKSQRTARYSSVRFLANKGVPVRIDSRYAIMHNKFLVIDGRTVETGSFNYTRAAQMNNAENALVLTNVPALAATYDREWNRLWAESQPLAAGSEDSSYSQDNSYGHKRHQRSDHLHSAHGYDANGDRW